MCSTVVEHILARLEWHIFFPISTPSTEVTSDASGSFGWGAFSLSHGWFQIQWPDNWHSLNIAAKELVVPIVIAAALWGHHWKHSCVRFNSDNMAVVGIIRSRTAKDPLLMHLVRCLVFYAASCGFEFIAEHVPGVDNTAADAISRNNIPLFHSRSTAVSCDCTKHSAGSTGHQDAQLGLAGVDSVVSSLFNQGISRSTRAVYQSGWRQYIHFCIHYTLSPLPLTEHTLCQFAAVLSQSVSVGTIRSYLSALQFQQISVGLSDPAYTSFPRLSYVAT